MNYRGDALEGWMSQAAEPLLEWSEPECYDPNDLGDRRQMYGRIVMGGAGVQRKVAEVADDLFELAHPDQKNDPVARQRYVEPIVAKGDRYGKWHYFPWSNQLVQYADKDDHRRLLTYRNRELITAEESDRISSATTMHVGLSVGSHIVTQVVHMGMGSKVILADPDILSVPNLNRIHAGMPEVGMRKTDITGMRVSELNPYVKQVHFPDGMNPRNAANVATHHAPDLIFEEVDHLPTKILMRRLAQQVDAALLMATDAGELTMIDIERYDLGDAEPFLGILSADELAKIESQPPSPQETVQLITRLIGLENISKRLAISMGQIGISLGGIAQLGTTASAGAAYTAVAGRRILLGKGPATGRYKVSPLTVLKLQ